MIEIEPKRFRVVGINTHRDSLAGLHCGLPGGPERFLHDCHVGFAARDIHFQFDPAQVVPIFIIPDLYER